MRTFLSTVVAFVAGLCGCGRAERNQAESLAVAVPAIDPMLEAATRQAQKSIGEFTAHLKEPASGQSDFSIKVAVNDDGIVHYLWLQKVSYQDSRFTGVLAGDAQGLKGHHPGEVITVPAEEIFDWMYVERGKLIGGFTLRAIRERLSGKQREAFEKTMWFAFD